MQSGPRHDVLMKNCLLHHHELHEKFLCDVVCYLVTSCHVVSYRIVSYHIVYHVVLYHIAIQWNPWYMNALLYEVSP